VEGETPADRAKILIVEDESVLALSLQNILEQENYAVVGTVSDFQRAFVIAQQEEPDLAIIDFKLANAIEGTTVARELTKRYGVGVIFTTGHAEELAARDPGLDHAILAKPYTAEQVLAAVDACLKRKSTAAG